MLTQITIVSCDRPGCGNQESSDDPHNSLVSSLYWDKGWSYLMNGDDLCPEHTLCDLCGEPWNAEIHAGPADTPSLHFFER